MRIYHGTRSTIAEQIRRIGLISPLGYDRAKWYTLAEDIASAAHHAQGYGGTPVVVEFNVPVGPRNRRWDGQPYLWPPYSTVWNGAPTRWWALRQPLPPEFVVAVREV